MTSKKDTQKVSVIAMVKEGMAMARAALDAGIVFDPTGDCPFHSLCYARAKAECRAECCAPDPEPSQAELDAPSHDRPEQSQTVH